MRKNLELLISIFLFATLGMPTYAIGGPDINVAAIQGSLSNGLFEFESPMSSANDINARGVATSLHAIYGNKPAYVGAMTLYAQGNSLTSMSKLKGGWFKQRRVGSDLFESRLIFGNYRYSNALGWQSGLTLPLQGASLINDNSALLGNVWFLEVSAGFKPAPKLDVNLSFSWLKVDKKMDPIQGLLLSAGTPEYASNRFETALNLNAQYKILNNLTYMIGAAYFWAGDYFKGPGASKPVDDNYLLMHSLNLSF